MGRWSELHIAIAMVVASTCSLTYAAADLHPPIPVPFELKEPGFVTLVIERPDGTRVRNLISETEFPAGKNVAYWDGLDDLGRDVDASKHSVYNVPGKPVEAGTYKARGLVRPALSLKYQFTPYSPGNPPWRTGDTSSGWLANHTAPSAVLWVPPGVAPTRENERADTKGWQGRPLVSRGAREAYTGPQILVASHVSEGGSGLAWLNSDGNKLHGQGWLGGIWTAASQLARDNGQNPVPGVYGYAAAYWKGDKYNNNIAEIRLNELLTVQGKANADSRMGRGDDRKVLDPYYAIPGGIKGADNSNMAEAEIGELRGMAVRDGLIVISLGTLDRLLFIDGRGKKVLGLAELKAPRGLEFESDGSLLALSGATLVRVKLPKVTAPADVDATSAKPTVTLDDVKVLVESGLEDPQQLALDRDGNVYVSDWGNSHQVKVFSRDGKPVRTIGKAGKPSVGPYDETGMRHPNGMTLDDRGQLWIAETDKAPKRVSVWEAATGKFVKALYGPAKYGGGGSIDSVDPSRFFYIDDGGGIEFSLDWRTGTDKVTSIYWKPNAAEFGVTGKWVGAGPQFPLHHDGRTYLTDCYTTSATDGVRAASLWIIENGIARPVAAMGNITDAARKIMPVFLTEPFAAQIPANFKTDTDALFFVWSDSNEDGKMTVDETKFMRPPTDTVKGERLIDGVTVGADLSFAIATFGDSAVQLKPTGFTKTGVPLYDMDKRDTLATGVNKKASSGHGQILVADDGWTILTTPPKPFSPYGLSGVKDGKPMWSYPSMWPGLHASHIAPVPTAPGMLLGTTRLMGVPFTVDGTDLGQVWAMMCNKGMAYLFTTDGLFVATLFVDYRVSEPWPATDAAEADVSPTSLQEECFGPTMTKAADGRLLIQGGGESRLIRLDGLNGARRLPTSDVQVTREQLAAAQEYFVQREAALQADRGPTELTLRVLSATASPVLDGTLGDWPTDGWVLIDERKKKVGNFGNVPARTEATLAIAGDRLYGAVRSDDPNLLNNSGEALQNLFKTGGAIDLMIGTDVKAPADRKAAVAGDQRLLITQVKGKTTAMLYEKVVKGAQQKFEFTSPVSSVRFAKVADVSADVKLAIGSEDAKNNAFKYGLYEFSIPLSALHLNAKAGDTIRGDIGVLRGNGYETTQRIYWTNKATGLVSDLPSEADLRPSLWGKFVLKSATK